MRYRDFRIVKDDYGYCVYKGSSHFESGFFRTYDEAVAAVDRFYRLLEVYYD